jgi:hypothetical protein
MLFLASFPTPKGLVVLGDDETGKQDRQRPQPRPRKPGGNSAGVRHELGCSLALRPHAGQRDKWNERLHLLQ